MLSLDMDKAESKQALSEILSQGKNIERQLNNLLSLSRLERKTLKVSMSGRTFRKLFEVISEHFKFNAQINRVNFEFAAEKNPQLDVDEALIEQIVHNLMSNALKYSYKNTNVTVRFALDNAGVPSISVINIGEQIPLTVRKKIFEKFYRVKDEYSVSQSGLGVGLYIVKNICQMLGYDIKVSSTEVNKTTFTVILRTQHSTGIPL